jgi:hypothetical protein
MSKLLLAQRFCLGFRLTKVSACMSSGSFRPRLLRRLAWASARKKGTQKFHYVHVGKRVAAFLAAKNKPIYYGRFLPPATQTSEFFGQWKGCERR